MISHKWKMKPETLQLIVALSALLIGVLVYLTTRSHQQVLFLNYLPEMDVAFSLSVGGLIYSIPSLLHIYAFILLTSVVISASINAARLICIFWLIIELVFETGQHPVVASAISENLPEWFYHYAWLQSISNYFINGKFDVLDVMCLVLGSVFAFITVKKLNGWG